MVEIDDDFKKAMLNRDEKLEIFKKYEITDDYLIGKLKSNYVKNVSNQLSQRR